MTWSSEVFARNLRMYLEVNNVTQKELADAIGVSAPTMNHYTKGTKYPRIDKLERMANFFGILKSDLTEDKGDIQKKNNLSVEVVLRMESDPEFFGLVETLCKLDGDKIRGINEMLRNFL